MSRRKKVGKNLSFLLSGRDITVPALKFIYVSALLIVSQTEPTDSAKKIFM
jgi:hypothetical protein